VAPVVFKTPPDPDLAERVWCLYAWPIRYGPGSFRTFFVNHEGRVLTTEHPGYRDDHGPQPNAAFATGDSITGPIAADATGGDGNVWSLWG
jgi:hypothetical protein